MVKATTIPSERPAPRDKPGPVPGFLRLVLGPGLGGTPSTGPIGASGVRVIRTACPDCFAVRPKGVVL